MKKGAHYFKTFPEFTALSWSHQDYIKELTSRYPATIQFSFHSLMSWWDQIDKCLIAELNGNLVFCFFIPGLERDSGFSILGDNEIDATICTIFDFMKERGDQPRLVHIPDFVLSSIRFPDMYKFVPEIHFDEMIVETNRFADISNLPKPKRSQLRHYMTEMEGRIKVQPIDLDKTMNREELLELIDVWRNNGPLNDYMKHEERGLVFTIKNIEKFDMNALGLYVDGRLQSFLIYERVSDELAHMGYTRFSYGIPNVVELTLYLMSCWFKEEGVKNVNLDSDFDLDVLRSTKLSLDPGNFRRMYTVMSSGRLKT